MQGRAPRFIQRQRRWLLLVGLLTFGIGSGSFVPASHAEAGDARSALHVLPPIGNATPYQRDFDRTLTPFVEVSPCEVTARGCIPAHVFSADHAVGIGQDIRLANNFYHVNWPILRTVISKTIRIHFFVAGMKIGTYETRVKLTRVLPIKFQIEDHPRIRARVLHHTNATADQVATAIRDEFELAAAETAAILRDETYGVLEIAGALAMAYSASAHEAAQLLSYVGFDAAEVATALLDFFGLGVEQTAQILADVGFDASDTALALTSVFGVNPQETARVLRDLGFAAVEVALALEYAFALDVQEAAEALSDAGFPVAEVTSALALAFGLDVEESARVLADVGFSLAEIAPALETVFALGRNEVHLLLAPVLIEIFAPVVHFHPDEAYLMSSVDWFLDGTTLLETDEGHEEVVFAEDLRGRASALGCVEREDCWLVASEAKKPGRLDGATTYVHVYHPPDHPDVVDLQFWLFYPYNGPGTLYSRIGELWDRQSVVDPIGSHPGDWESVTIRFDDGLEPIQVFLSQHGYYPSYPIGEFDMLDGEHVKSYASLNGHANYAAAGNNAHRQVHANLGLGHLDVDFYNRCSDAGTSFEAHGAYEIVAFDGAALPGHEWIGFPGNWGPTLALHMDPGSMPQLVWDHFWPGVWAGCAIVSAVCGPLYPLCYVACLGGATLAAELARDDIIDEIYPGGLVANGPSSPATKTSWDYPSDPY